MSSFGMEDPDSDLMVAEEIAITLPARVILYNDDEHTFDEVIFQLMKAVGCSRSEGEQFAFEVDSRGLACVFEGEMTDCLRVSSVLEEISLHTEVKF
ncbi:MAG: ATP-dependent Clp protease adaptor ClpS [Bacteroidetes bacterium]|nr:ATP-dependent Clp protease adaptor ClpS [Bacteroidota bacterium]